MNSFEVVSWVLFFFLHLHHDFDFDFDFNLTLTWVDSDLLLIFHPYFIYLCRDLYDSLLITSFNIIMIYVIYYWYSMIIIWTTSWFVYAWPNNDSDEVKRTNMKRQQFIHAYRWYVLVILRFVWLDSLSNTL